MKALDFESRLSNKDRIQLPPDSSEDERWRQLSLERFSAAYAEEDSVYENLIHGPASR